MVVLPVLLSPSAEGKSHALPSALLLRNSGPHGCSWYRAVSVPGSCGVLVTDRYRDLSSPGGSAPMDPRRPLPLSNRTTTHAEAHQNPALPP